MKSKLAILTLAWVCLCGTAKADSTAMAEASTNWAGTTFSSPVSPAPLANNPYASIVQATGFVSYPFDINTFQGGTTTDVGWADITFTELFSPGNVAVGSTTATTIDATATNTRGTVGTQMAAQAERSGAISTLNGNVVIGVPYTLTATAATNPIVCCSELSAQIFLELWNGGQLLQIVGAADFSTHSFSQSGTLVLDETGLAPGTYQFDIGAASSSTVVPEPGTLGPLGLGFALFWRRLKPR
jgi:hypothetical protein